jgi:prepilin-type processing-associated H-X9-DG protein
VKFIIEFKINGETVIDNWVDHIGQSLEFDVDEKTGNEAVSNAGQVWVTDAEGNTRQIYALILGDYAINRGSYEGAGGRILTGVDPSLFYILDYGYKRSVADYNKVGDEDEWDKFFITDPVRWERSFGGEGRNWREHQALRHFGTANVLFCDGHIESLGPEDLEYTNPRWTYRGR